MGSKSRSQYAIESEHVVVKVGKLDLCLTQTQIREAMRTAIKQTGASTLLRHDVSERGIETAIEEFMKWLVVPTLREIR